MFICDTETGGILSAQLDGPKVQIITSDEHGRTAEVKVDAATVRGMIEELAAMADELDAEQLAAEVAAADTAEEAAQLADPTHFCRTCGFYHTERQIREALGECPRWTAEADMKG